jgi:hypothetical protein
MTLASEDKLTTLVSVISIFAQYSFIMANSFSFWYMVERRARFFALAPMFLTNSRYLNELKLSDIFTLNN